jgi:hypothetical protein
LWVATYFEKNKCACIEQNKMEIYFWDVKYLVKHKHDLLEKQAQ